MEGGSGEGPAAVEMPAVLVEAFDGDRRLLRWVGTLRPAWQREIAKHVMEPVSDEARVRRAGVMAERLLLTMEAEEELPPWVKVALERTAYAWAGWERMTVARRRDFLLTIFGARSLAARQVQVGRLVEGCVGKGEGEWVNPMGRALSALTGWPWYLGCYGTGLRP